MLKWFSTILLEIFLKEIQNENQFLKNKNIAYYILFVQV